MTRRRKHWGWGYEDQQPDRAALEAIARAVHERLGFEVDEIEEPVPLEAVESRRAAAEATRAARRAVLRRSLRPRLARARQGLPRRGPRLPGRVRGPARPGRVSPSRPRTSTSSSPGARRRAGRRDPVRRRHQRRRRVEPRMGRRRGRWSRSTCGGWTGCSRWTRSRARRGSRPGAPGPASRSSSASTASPCATSRSRSSTRPSAAGSRPAPAGTSRPSTRTSTTWSSRSARSPRGRSGRAGGCRARAPGPARTGCCSARRGSSA